MDSFFTIAIVILFGLSVFVLARADGWSRLASWAVAVGIFALPAALFVVLYVLRVPAYVFETVLGVAGLGAFIVLFALAKSVSNKIRGHDDASR